MSTDEKLTQSASDSFDVIVIGAGPAGYPCAIRAAQLFYQMGAVDREFPFQPEVPFGPLMDVSRDNRDEEGAGLDLFADRLVPGIAAAKLQDSNAW